MQRRLNQIRGTLHRLDKFPDDFAIQLIDAIVFGANLPGQLTVEFNVGIDAAMQHLECDSRHVLHLVPDSDLLSGKQPASSLGIEVLQFVI